MAKLTARLTLDTAGLASEFESATKGLRPPDFTVDTAKASSALREVVGDAKKAGSAIGQEGASAGAEFAGKFEKETAGLGAKLAEGLKASGIGDALFGGLIGGGVAGVAQAGLGAITGAFSGAVEAGRALISAQGDLQAKTGATAEEFDKLKASAREAFRGGVGESLADATKVIAEAKNQLDDAFSTEELGTFTARAQALGNLFDKDVNEVIMKSAPFVKQFGLDGERAFNLLSLTMQKAGTAQDDVLDSLAEYSLLAKEAGFTAEQFAQSLVVAGEAGAFNTDKVADAIKETQIRLKAGDIQKGIGEIAGLPADLAKVVTGGVDAVNSGQQSLQQFLASSAGAIEKAFNAGQISEDIRTQLQVAISGTPAEDLGSGLWARVMSASVPDSAIQASAQQAGQAVQKAVGQYLTFDTLGREFELQFQEVAGFLIGAFDKAVVFFTDVLAPTFEGVVADLGKAWEQLEPLLLPVLEVVAGFIAGTLIVAIQRVAEVVSITFRVVAGVLSRVLEVLAPIGDAFASLFGAVDDGTDPVEKFTAVLQDFGTIASDVGDVVVEFAGFVTELLVTGIRITVELVEELVGWFSDLGGATGDTANKTEQSAGAFETLRTILRGIVAGISGATAGFRSLVDSVIEIQKALLSFEIGDAFNAFIGAFGKASDTASKTARAKFVDAFGKIGDAIEALKGKASTLTLPDLTAEADKIRKAITEAYSGQLLDSAQADALNNQVAELFKTAEAGTDAVADATAKATARTTAQVAGTGKVVSELQKALKAYKAIEAEQKATLDVERTRLRLLGRSGKALEAGVAVLEQQTAETLIDKAEGLFRALTDEYGLFLTSSLQLVGDETFNDVKKIFADLALQAKRDPVRVRILATRENVASDFFGREAVPIPVAPVVEADGLDGFIAELLGSVEGVGEALFAGLDSVKLDKIFAPVTDDAEETTEAVQILRDKLAEGQITAQAFAEELRGVASPETAGLFDKLGKALVGVGQTFTEAYAPIVSGAVKKAQEALAEGSEDAGAKTAKAYEAVAIASGGALVTALAEGKNAFGAFVTVALDALDALVPIITAQLFGLYASSPNPANVLTFGGVGTASALAVGALFKGLVALARSAVGSFAEGGYTGDGGRLSVAGIVHRGEFVSTAETVANPYNRALLEFMHGGGDVSALVARDNTAELVALRKDVRFLAGTLERIAGGYRQSAVDLRVTTDPGVVIERMKRANLRALRG